MTTPYATESAWRERVYGPVVRASCPHATSRDIEDAVAATWGVNEGYPSVRVVAMQVSIDLERRERRAKERNGF